jgi:hypothetical protein
LQSNFYNSKSNEFKNLIMLLTNASYYTRVFQNCDNNEITNCIVMNENSYFFTGSGNIIYNNIFRVAHPDFGSNNINADNYFSVDLADIFIDQTGGLFSYSDDYHLVYPETYLGTDGSEVGIYGGIFPFKAGSVPITPHITVKEVAPATDPDGNLNVTIQVDAQQN